MEDGTLVPIEITKTTIDADGFRSVTREIPDYVKNGVIQVGHRSYSTLDQRKPNQNTYSQKEFKTSNAYRDDQGKIILNRTETTNVYQTKPKDAPTHSTLVQGAQNNFQIP